MEEMTNYYNSSATYPYYYVPLSNCLGNTTAIQTYSPTVSCILILLTGSFCLLTLIGNVAVIIVICNGSVRRSHQQRKSQQHIYLVSLAIADASLAILVVPFSLANELLGKWPFGDVYCRIYLSVDILLCTASIWSICCIGFDRYISVRFPTAFQQYRSVPRILCFTFSIWIFSAGVSVLPFLGELTTIQGSDHCFVNDVTWYIVLSSSLSFLIPTCFIIPLYSCIYVVGIKIGSKFRAGYAMPQYEAKSPPVTSRQQTYRSDHGRSTTDIVKRIQRRTTKTGGYDISNPVLKRSQSVKVGESSRMQERKQLSSYEENKTGNALLPVVSYSLLAKENNKEAAGRASQETIEHKDTEAFLTVPSAHDIVVDYSSNQPRSRNVIQNNGVIFEEVAPEQRRMNIFWSCFLKLGLVKKSDSSEHVAGWRSPVSMETNSNRLPSVASIGTILKQIRIKRESSASLHSCHGRAKRERRFTYIIVIVCGCYMLCWSPFFVSYLVYSICRQNCCVNATMFKSFFWLGYLNSGINPILYTIFNQDFRRAFKKLFRIEPRRNIG